jgi:hypothetical protein
MKQKVSKAQINEVLDILEIKCSKRKIQKCENQGKVCNPLTNRCIGGLTLSQLIKQYKPKQSPKKSPKKSKCTKKKNAICIEFEATAKALINTVKPDASVGNIGEIKEQILSLFPNIEKNEVDFGNGQFYYYYLAMDDMNKRYMNQAFFKIMEGVAVDNLSNGTVGTLGVIPRVSAAGSTIQYSASSGPVIADIHTLTRTLNFYGGAGEYHFLQDIYQRQAVNDLLFGKYNNGAIRYASVGGSEEASVSYGFNSFSIDGYTFHFFLNNMFSPEAVYQINPGAQVPEKRKLWFINPSKD